MDAPLILVVHDLREQVLVQKPKKLISQLTSSLHKWRNSVLSVTSFLLDPKVAKKAKTAIMDGRYVACLSYSELDC